MTCSPARLAANRQDAQRSTVPQTPAGKATSRLNAFRHGQAGAGDLLGPVDDEQEVTRRAREFARELAIEDEVGWTLARRAALLSVRMEALAARDEVMVQAHVRTAQAGFDDELAADLAEQVAALTSEAQTRDALQALESWPAGLDYLVLAWRDLGAASAAEAVGAADQLRRWLGEPAFAATGAELAARVAAEVERLQRLAATMNHARAAMAAARAEVGVLASFDPAPEASLARRYEAAAERGMYRALRAIADHHRTHGSGSGPLPLPHPAAPVGQAGLPASQPAASTAPDPSVIKPMTALGSFRAAVPASGPPLDLLLGRLGEPPIALPADRPQRPNLAKFLKKCR